MVLLRQQQENGKDAALARGRGDSDMTPIQLDQLTGYGQPEPCARDIPLCFDPEESFKEVRDVFRLNADAVIYYAQNCPTALGQALAAGTGDGCTRL
jgi:hypothetical protein